jgi:pimeloyl-ACP methyl ester carboxylesterase
MKWRKRIALAVGIVIAVGLVVSWLVGGMLLAPKPLVIGPPPGELQAEPIALESESGSTLAGWHLPVPDAQAVLVLGHGVRGSRLDSLRRAVLWQEAGYAVVIIDLQAHGESPGAHITVGHLEQHDIRAAVAFAKAGYASARVGVLGMSMGGAAAILASPLDIDALVIESVFRHFVRRFTIASQSIWGRSRAFPHSCFWRRSNLASVSLQLNYARSTISPKFAVLSSSSQVPRTPTRAQQKPKRCLLPLRSPSNSGLCQTQAMSTYTRRQVPTTRLA